MKVLCIALTAGIIAACSSPQTHQQRSVDTAATEGLGVAGGAAVRAKIDGVVASAKKDADDRKVNENWSVHCTADQVTTTRTCRAFTFGQMMNGSGEGFGSKSIPFQVFFVGKLGPFVQVGYHTYPGRHPTVRVNDNKPTKIQDDGGVSPPKPVDMTVIEQLRGGQIVRARYHSWPKGGQDMIVDIEGFDAAWNRLLEQKSAP